MICIPKIRRKNLTLGMFLNEIIQIIIFVLEKIYPGIELLYTKKLSRGESFCAKHYYLLDCLYWH